MKTMPSDPCCAPPSRTASPDVRMPNDAHGHDPEPGHRHGPGHVHAPLALDGAPPGYGQALVFALVVNAAMFMIEIASGLGADSASLLADAADFFGDALNYGLSLAVLAQAAIWRARVALFKGLTMAIWGLSVLAQAGWHAWNGAAPQAWTMGSVGLLALAANLAVAWRLMAWSEGDANMRAVWLCTRNDAIGNVAVVAAAVGVFGTGTRWPDLAVAAAMAVLALVSGLSVVRQARHELNASRRATSTPA